MRLVDFLDYSLALSDCQSNTGPATYGAGAGRRRGFHDLDNNHFMTYQEMVNASVHIAAVLRQKGVGSQDIIATYMPNSVAAYCCIFAISRIGAVWLPLNVRNTLDANLQLIDKSDASMLFLDESIAVKHPELIDYLGKDHSIFLDGQQIAGLAFSSLVEAPVDHQKLVGLESFDQESVPENSLGNVTISLFATGGTTGDSKLAEWSDLTWQTIADIQRQLMPETDIPSCYLVAAPMTHAAGIASFTAVLQGASIVVMDGMVPERLLSVIESYRVTQMFLPPTAVYMLLAHDSVKQYDYSSLRYFWYAAAPMSVEKLKEAMATFGPVMVQTYGQAEAPMSCTFLSAQDHLLALETNDSSILRSCGKVAPFVELAILDDEGNKLPQGQEGEVAVKGNLLMAGYYKNPEATSAIRENGWQRTGDVGVLNEKGYLAIVDRKKDMIISGGFNVYPSEIEQVIWGLPEIKDCAVIGLPDEKWGEQVTAVVELKNPETVPDEQKIIQHCKNKLGSVKAPKQVLFWDKLPRSPVGKVLKKEIRKFFWGEQGRKI